MTSRFLKSYEERVLDAIADAVQRPQTVEDPFASDPLDYNPTRSTWNSNTLLLEDPETGLLYEVTVRLL